MNRKFTEEEFQTTNKYIKRCSTSQIIKEIQNRQKYFSYFILA